MDRLPLRASVKSEVATSSIATNSTPGVLTFAVKASNFAGRIVLNAASKSRTQGLKRDNAPSNTIPLLDELIDDVMTKEAVCTSDLHKV